MYNRNSLNELKSGQKAMVTTVLSTGTIRRRLQDIGLIKGTIVECIQRGPSGDPTAYLIKGAVIALRCEDSTNILIESV